MSTAEICIMVIGTSIAIVGIIVASIYVKKALDLEIMKQNQQKI
jgi:hypothetical protein